MKKNTEIQIIRMFDWSHSAVKALFAVKKRLTDPKNYLRGWNRGDPCMSNWTRVICENMTRPDGYFHVIELYVCRIYYLDYSFLSLYNHPCSLILVNFLSGRRLFFFFFSSSLFDEIFGAAR